MNKYVHQHKVCDRLHIYKKRKIMLKQTNYTYFVLEEGGHQDLHINSHHFFM